MGRPGLSGPKCFLQTLVLSLALHGSTAPAIMATLTLVIEKGPKKVKGGTIQCNRPDDEVRIGRILRGNTFTIKESSISQNHLSIHFHSNKWLLTDLQSSNGTFLNENAIAPHTPTPLTHGDLIKIGYGTSIAVSVNTPLPPKSPKKEELPARYATRRRGNVEPLLSLDQLEKSKVDGDGRPPRGKKTVSEAEVVGLERKKVGGIRRRGRPGGKKKPIKQETEEFEVVGLETEEIEVVEQEKEEIEVVQQETEEIEVVDPEKKTLAAWFDDLDKYIPMMINDIADESIAEIKERSRLFKDFLSQKFIPP